MKTVIITGASGNLGQAMTKKFLLENWAVVGTVTNNSKAGFESDENFEAVTVDIADEQAATSFIENTIKKYKAIDAVILTVGGFATGKIVDTNIATFEKQFKLNFHTTYNVVRPVFTHMLEKGSGRVFLTGARAGSDMRFGKGTVAYAMMKSLIFRLAESMNEEAKGTDVVTAVIAPSTIDTPQNRSGMPDNDFSKWVKPEHISEIVYAATTEAFSDLRDTVIKVYNRA